NPHPDGSDTRAQDGHLGWEGRQRDVGRSGVLHRHGYGKRCCRKRGQRSDSHDDPVLRENMKTTLRPLLLPLALIVGLCGLLIARSGAADYSSFCDNPVPTPSPTPQPTPPPKCQPEDPCKNCTSSP